MAETSFPLVGADLSDDAWAQTVGASGSGVLDDWGNPYAIVLNINDTVTVKPSTRGPARAVVNGFGHQLDVTKTLTVPAVTASTTYNIGLLYDPENATMPVLLTVLTAPQLAQLAPGRVFLPLHSIVRAAGQTLAAATLLTLLPALQPRLLSASKDAVLAASPLRFLKGTTIECTDVKRPYRAGGTLTSPTWEAGPTQGTWQGTRTAQNVGSGQRVAALTFSPTVVRDAGWMDMQAGAFKLDDGHYVISATMKLGAPGSDGRSFVEIAPANASADSLARAPLPDGEYIATVTWNGWVSASNPLAVWLFQQHASTANKPDVKLSVTRIA
ncbi:hypothetical protein E9228_002962 [Curtobacterium flaccumfaciens]|uniref:DUF1214 domain-containing protein n=1 Tax=Curtobacterium salicis TaxID=1779862 RepID=A0ABX0TEI9_9MICO|nr:hypothetical protein [Curtobacterium sp. WW7]NII42304.1 hypothetical protein [Curtobacterium sp. WW7]